MLLRMCLEEETLSEEKSLNTGNALSRWGILSVLSKYIAFAAWHLSQ